jgi:hypothetical protein
MHDAAACGNREGVQLVDELSITWSDPFVARTEPGSAGKSQTIDAGSNGTMIVAAGLWRARLARIS